MRNWRAADPWAEAIDDEPEVAPGKQNLTAALMPRARSPLPVQRRALAGTSATIVRSAPAPALDDPFWFGAVQAREGSLDPSAVGAHAARGVEGAAGALPYADALQASFGHHDLHGVGAHVGGAAATAAHAIGASAYATGDRIAFASSPDLHTVAHEAAHVVQQRRGVQLDGGVGAAGDRYEQHADAVADRVVRGESAADLLDQLGGGGGAARPAVQRRAAPPIGARVRVLSEPAPDPGAAFQQASSGSAGALPYRDEMERSFGEDLGGVRAHVGRAEALRGSGMSAAARGEQVVFGDASPTREEVAHEVAHVVQHRRGGGGGAAVSSVDDAAEREADAIAGPAAAGASVSVRAAASAELHPHRAKVIDQTSALVGRIFDIVGGSSAGHVYIRTDDGQQLTLNPGTYELVPDAPAPEPADSKKRKSTSDQPMPAASASGGTDDSAAGQSQSSFGSGGFQFDPSAFGAGFDFGLDEKGVGGQGGAALDVSTVIVQADFMSGDRYGVAAALTLEQTLGVVILTTEATRAKAEDIKRFYDDVLTRIGSDGGRIGIAVVADPHQAYVNREGIEEDSFWNLVGGAVQVSATYGTETVARQLARWGTVGPDAVPAYLAQQLLGEPRGEQAAKRRRKGKSGGTDGDSKAVDGDSKAATPAAASDPAEEAHGQNESALRDWLAGKGLLPGSYALIWSKTGAPTAEKAHHFTSPHAACQLIALAVKHNRIPILVGDDLGVAQYLPASGINLGEFWNDASFPFGHEGRIGQLRLFRFLATSEGYDTVNIGMRSGALEGPALMGMQTIYLEEEGNSQARRMEKWMQLMPNYHRVVLGSTPGTPQRRYLMQVIANHIARVRIEEPQLGDDQVRYIDWSVPVALRDKYLAFLQMKLELVRFQLEIAALDREFEGFEPTDLSRIDDLLGRSGVELAQLDKGDDSDTPGYSPSYAEMFMETQGDESGDESDRGGRDDDSKDRGRDGDSKDRGRDGDSKDRGNSGSGNNGGSGSNGSGADAKAHGNESAAAARPLSVAERVLARLSDQHMLMGTLGGADQVARMVATTDGPMLWDLLEAFAGLEAQLVTAFSGRNAYMSIAQAHADLKSGVLKRR